MSSLNLNGFCRTKQKGGPGESPSPWGNEKWYSLATKRNFCLRMKRSYWFGSIPTCVFTVPKSNPRASPQSACVSHFCPLRPLRFAAAGRRPPRPSSTSCCGKRQQYLRSQWAELLQRAPDSRPLLLGTPCGLERPPALVEEQLHEHIGHSL